MTDAPALPAFLRERRARLDPAALGFASKRRRTPGLRREEVAQRAGISTVWYSWLEQGRGGPPSADVVERLAGALMLAPAEREHLFLLALGRPPDVDADAVPGGTTPRLQHVLDAFTASPAVVRTATWDVVAWNAASERVLTRWGDLPPPERNILRRIFLDPASHDLNPDWERIAKSSVNVLRADAARFGALVLPFVERLGAESAAFASFWRDDQVQGLDEGERRLRHSSVGEMAFGFSSFTVQGRADLVMMVHTPATEADRQKIESLLN